MRYLIVLTSIIISFVNNGLSQEMKKNANPPILKEDRNNAYKSEQITSLDLIQALEIAGIRINKFYLGQFDRDCKLFLVVDEYVDSKIVKSDTVLAQDNLYTYYERGFNDPFEDYIDQIKIFTKDEDDKIILFIKTYAMSTKKEISYTKNDKEQFFTWRNYFDTTWKLDKKIPLMVYASSWKDKEYGLQRFCGAVNLSENDKKTKELLSSSPHYFSIYYMVTEIKN